MAHRFYPMNLKTRVLLVVATLVFVGIWGFAALISSLLQKDTEKLVAHQLTAAVDFVADELDDELRLRVELLKDIATSIRLDTPVDAAKVQRLLDEQKPPSAIFPLGILVTDKDGVIIAGHSPSPARRNGTFLGDRDFIREVMSKDKPVIGHPIIGRFSGQALIPIAVPLHDANGAVAGVLHAPFRNSDRDLFGKLRDAKVGRSGRFLVMSPRDHVIVAATETSEIMKPLPPRGVNRMTDRRLYEGFEGAAVTVTPTGVEVLGASRNLHTTGWILVGNITTEEAFAPIRTFKNHIYVGALLVSLVISVVLYVLLRQQLSPLDKAGAAMQQMTAGTEPFGAIPVKRDDEIGRLVRSFNELAAGRQRAEEEIRHLNRTLEDRVKERTGQLLAANEHLETEVSQRRLAEQSARDYADRVQLMSRRAVEVQEAEQHRLARELHDRVSSNLTAIAMDLRTIEKQFSDDAGTKVKDRLLDCTAILKDTIMSVREISAELHPTILEYPGLVPALKDLGERVAKRTGMMIEITAPQPGTKLPAEKELALFRIAQEALMNCTKHSRAKAVAIGLHHDSDKLTFSIKDDGVGFDPLKMQGRGQPSGLGLIAIRERAEAIEATCCIDAAPGAGTRIVVDLRNPGPVA